VRCRIAVSIKNPPMESAQTLSLQRVHGHTGAVAERQIMLLARQRLVLGQLQQ
jgi:hypothetical protein